MIFTNKNFHWVPLVHVEADNYFILITSIDAKWLSKMIRKIRILNKASHCTLRCYNHCGHRNVPSEDRVFYGQVWVYFGPRHTSGGWRFRLYCILLSMAGVELNPGPFQVVRIFVLEFSKYDIGVPACPRTPLEWPKILPRLKFGSGYATDIRWTILRNMHRNIIYQMKVLC